MRKSSDCLICYGYKKLNCWLLKELINENKSHTTLFGEKKLKKVKQNSAVICDMKENPPSRSELDFDLDLKTV